MICQQYTTAIKEGYANHLQPDLAQQAEAARARRERLASLEIEHQLRGALVEQIEALEISKYQPLLLKSSQVLGLRRIIVGVPA